MSAYPTTYYSYLQQHVHAHGFLALADNKPVSQSAYADAYAYVQQAGEEGGRKRTRAVAESPVLCSPEHEALSDLIYWSLSK
ncbi:hypothetical protein EON65_53670 [archaeon]|nr:MAG: hypothetical protein EON65_53670 [archaeon]